MMEKYMDARKYFSGDVFSERASTGNQDEAEPLLYPLAINLVKMMCVSQAGALWGQFEDEIATWYSEPEKDTATAKDAAQRAVDFVTDVWDGSNVGSMLYEAGLSQQVYGGIYLRAAKDLARAGNVRVDKLLPYNVFPRYHPVDPNRILEAYIVIPIDAAEAHLAYGIEAQGDTTVYVEHWTETEYNTFIGDQRLDNFSGKNPWGWVPLEYFPRTRMEGFYGLSLAEDIMGLQDELNGRLADVGDNVSSAAHPIRWVRNYRGSPDDDFQMGPDALWDLGQNLAGQADPEVGVLPAQAEPTSTFSFITFLMDISRNIAGTSPVAFGEDEGSQRSGATLVLRLWPLLQSAKATRLFWRDGLIRLNHKIQIIGGKAPLPVTSQFSELVPQDRQLLIDEIIRRAQENLISPEEAITRFGVVDGSVADEVKRIQDWLDYKTEKEAEVERAGLEARQQQMGEQPNSESKES
jgi:hypothetical protein